MRLSKANLKGGRKTAIFVMASSVVKFGAATTAAEVVAAYGSNLR
jgi:hypothetical protein